MKKGLFVTFEGLDLTGKSTLIKLLKERNENWIFTREPGGTDCKLAEDIRNFILNYPDIIDSTTEAYLFAASRAAHTQQIEKWLNEGKTVICDRYLASSMYYQGVMKGLESKIVKDINCIAVGELYPHKSFFVTVSEIERNKRMSLRKEINQLDKQSADVRYIEANIDYYNITNELALYGTHLIDTTDGDTLRHVKEIEKIIDNMVMKNI